LIHSRRLISASVLLLVAAVYNLSPKRRQGSPHLPTVQAQVSGATELRGYICANFTPYARMMACSSHLAPIIHESW